MDHPSADTRRGTGQLRGLSLPLCPQSIPLPPDSPTPIPAVQPTAQPGTENQAASRNLNLDQQSRQVAGPSTRHPRSALASPTPAPADHGAARQRAGSGHKQFTSFFQWRGRLCAFTYNGVTVNSRMADEWAFT